MKERKYLLIVAAVLIVGIVLWIILAGTGTKQESSEQRELNGVPEPAAVENRQAVEQTAVPEQKAVTEEKAATGENAVPEESAETGKKQAMEKEQPFLVQVTEDDPSIAYVLVRLPQTMGLLPLPVEGEYTRTIRQVMDDGTEAVNILHLTPDGFWMEDANCEGHDCINEGEVTLSNREERVLWNMVICLPHQLSAELITREEALKMLKQ